MSSRRRSNPETVKSSHPNAYTSGIEAGQTLRAVIANRLDFACTFVEWYRGFCDGAGYKPDKRVESAIAASAGRTTAVATTGGEAVHQARREVTSA